MIYKYTKCESVIAKIMADLDANDIRNRISDIREWIFEAVEKIGAPVQYIQKESGIDGVPVLKIEDGQVPLPDDLVMLDGVAYGPKPDGLWVPVRKETSSIHSWKGQKAKRPQEIMIEHDHENRTIPDSIPVPPEHGEPYHKLMTSQSQIYTQFGSGHYDGHKLVNLLKQPTYWLKPGWVVLNRKGGYIKLMYKAIATDERGYPLIPDLESYQEAIYWYVTMKLTFPKFLKGTLGGKSVRDNRQVYMYIQQQWAYYRNQAYTEAIMPTQDDMRSIKNDWLKLIPDVDADDYFFEPVGHRETTYNDYYYGY